MLTENALQDIARTGYYGHRKRYAVVLDNTPPMDDNDSPKDSDYTVIHHGNNYDRAVEVTNFWDERQNVHLVEIKNAVHMDIAYEIEKRDDLKIEKGHKLYDAYMNLSAKDLAAVMAKAAKARLWR